MFETEGVLIMRQILVCMYLLMIGGCSTVGSLRNGPSPQAISSSHSVERVTACIVKRWDESTFTLLSSVRPLPDGGTSLIIRNGYGGTALLVDVKPSNAGAHIEIYVAALLMNAFIDDVKSCAA